jgi:hypothetical protein
MLQVLVGVATNADPICARPLWELEVMQQFNKLKGENLPK